MRRFVGLRAALLLWVALICATPVMAAAAPPLPRLNPGETVTTEVSATTPRRMGLGPRQVAYAITAKAGMTIRIAVTSADRYPRIILVQSTAMGETDPVAWAKDDHEIVYRFARDGEWRLLLLGGEPTGPMTVTMTEERSIIPKPGLYSSPVMGMWITEYTRGESPPVQVAAAPPPRPAQPAQVNAAPGGPPPVYTAAATPAVAGPRVALVMGNGAYDARLGPLANPVNDAATMATALRAAGFDVELVTNADQRAMKRAITRLGERIAAKGRNATGLFFYAGHGMQSRGVNYLAPIGAAIDKESDVDIEAVAAESVLRQMEGAGNSINIVILDACRNTPVQRMVRDGTRGLARMDSPNGSFVAYSTAPGSVAIDGTGANSPFVTALVKEIRKPGLDIELVFRNVRREVQTATGGKQTPWDSSSLTDAFVFVPAS